MFERDVENHQTRSTLMGKAGYKISAISGGEEDSESTTKRMGFSGQEVWRGE